MVDGKLKEHVLFVDTVFPSHSLKSFHRSMTMTLCFKIISLKRQGKKALCPIHLLVYLENRILTPLYPIITGQVSKLPFISKILEKVVAKQLTTVLDEHNIFDKFQCVQLLMRWTTTSWLRDLGSGWVFLGAVVLLLPL